MIYVKKLILPSDYAETKVIEEEKRTCFNTMYPFKIFPQKQLQEVSFNGITLLYGGNGSGKSTLINVMARKMNAIRYSEFNDAPFFDQYINMCRIEYVKAPPPSYVLSSDDVFDYVLNVRDINETIDEKRKELFEKYDAMKSRGFCFNWIENDEKWRDMQEILSPKMTRSKYVKKHLAPNIDLYSNGETAMRYFINRIDKDAVYFLDEPENSLSVEFQIQLAEYIQATARATKSQFIIATHSPIFLAMKNTQIYNLDDYPASTCRWTELPNVRKYFDFFMEHQDEFE